MARIQGKTTSDDYKCFAGIDVSKAHLDLHVHGTRKGRRFANTLDGIAALLDHLGSERHLVVLEPTGRYHLAVWMALDGAHDVAPVKPFSARRLAEGLGHLAKTDAIDAQLLSLISARLSPPVLPAPDEKTQEIRALYAHKQSLIRRRAMAKTQMAQTNSPEITALLKQEIADQSARIKALDALLRSRIKAHEPLARTHEILTSIPGIAQQGAEAILVLLPQIGRATNGEIAALTGCAPMTSQSGQRQGQSRTRGGRRNLRTALHMPAVAALSHNPDLKAFADRLRAKGKHGSVIVTAVLRKLVILANTLVAQDRLWTPERP